jgi:hypothetical protein
MLSCVRSVLAIFLFVVFGAARHGVELPQASWRQSGGVAAAGSTPRVVSRRRSHRHWSQ